MDVTGGRQARWKRSATRKISMGIIAGAPTNFQTHLHAFDIVVQTAVRQPGAAVPPAKVGHAGEIRARRL